MSKELEALNKLFVLSSEYHQKLWCLKLAPVFPEERERYIDRIIKSLPNDAGELNDLYNYIKQAIKRNEPMKVDLVTSYDGLLGCFKCPKCGETLRRYYNYCPDCGKALDWSDDEN